MSPDMVPGMGPEMRTVTPVGQEEVGSTAQRERRTRILDATISLATKGGFDAVQMRAVAEDADVALGTLYRYFPSKIHLLVTALGRELERSGQGMERKAVPGETRQERVKHVLRRQTKGLQQDPHLTEALVRAFMFADAAVAKESHVVGMHLTRLLVVAMADQSQPFDNHEPTDQEVAIARVISDVWLATLVQWVTGRATTAEVSERIDTAIELVLR